MPTTPEVWLDEFQVNTTDSGPAGDDQRESKIVQLDNGNIVVLYEDASDGGPAGAGGTDIIGQIYDPLGNPIGAEFRANQSFFADDEGDFDVVALTGGRFVVVFEDDPGPDADVAIRATEWSTDAFGVTTSITRTIAESADAGDIVRKPSVDAFDDGSYVVAYEQFDSSASDNDLRFRIVSSTGVVGAEQVSISGSSSSSADTDVAVLSNGNIAFTYDFDTTDDAIAYRVHTSTGGSVTGANFVNGTNANGGVDTDASLIALENGGFVISWTNTDANDTDVQFQRYDNSGVEQSGIVNVDAGATTDNNNESHLIALADGSFIVTYDDDEANTIVARHFSATGAALGSPFVVNDGGGTEVDPSGIGLDDGRFIVGWTESAGGNNDVFVEFLDTRDAPNNPGVYTPDQWVIGTVGDDVFTPNANAEFIHGWDGNDTITESGGTREYYGDNGNDTIIVVSAINADRHDGGAGSDTIDWSAVAEIGATFNLAAGTATDASANVEVMVSFENLNGTNNADTIIGSAGGNVLNGNGGNDRIEGGSGTDTMDGGNGNDTMLGGFNTDSVNGGAGDDRIIVLDGEFFDNVDGGTGTDTLDHSDVTRSGDVFDFQAGEIISTFATGTPTIANIEVYLDGSGSNTIISDGSGAYFGNGGNDLMFSGLGTAETLDGGAGIDTLNTTTFTGDYEVNLSSGGTNFPPEFFINFENLVSGIGDDTLTGTNGANNIDGGDGADEIYGLSGNDTMNGGLGRDTMEGGTGDDFYLVDDSRDRANENPGGGNDTVISTVDFRLRADVENLILSGSAADDLTGKGNAENNVIVGDAGDNRIDGGGGSDTVSGNGGNDVLIGSGSGDSLAGGTGEDTLRGEGGSDTLVGGADDDRIEGGDGNDDLIGGTEADLFVFADDFGRDTIFDFEDGLDRINLRDIREENGNAPLALDQLLLTQLGTTTRIELDLDMNGAADVIDLDGDAVGDVVRIDVLNTVVGDFDAADFVF